MGGDSKQKRSKIEHGVVIRRLEDVLRVVKTMKHLKVEEALSFRHKNCKENGFTDIKTVVLDKKALYFYKNIEGNLVRLQAVTVDWTR